MTAKIIVAVACNLIAVLLLLSGVFSAKSNGLKVTLVKFFMSLGGAVGAYFITPVLSNKLYGVDKVAEFCSHNAISKGSINSCIFLLFFLFVYALTLIICSIIKHASVKKLQNKRVNKAKMKRARSINPRAERAAKRAEWRAAKLAYKQKRRWYNQLIACCVGFILALVVGVVVLMPFGYISKDINVKHDKQFLIQGYEYTLNGVLPEKVFDKVVHIAK